MKPFCWSSLCRLLSQCLTSLLEETVGSSLNERENVKIHHIQCWKSGLNAGHWAERQQHCALHHSTVQVKTSLSASTFSFPCRSLWSSLSLRSRTFIELGSLLGFKIKKQADRSQPEPGHSLSAYKFTPLRSNHHKYNNIKPAINLFKDETLY